MESRFVGEESRTTARIFSSPRNVLCSGDGSVDESAAGERSVSFAREDDELSAITFGRAGNALSAWKNDWSVLEAIERSAIHTTNVGSFAPSI